MAGSRGYAVVVGGDHDGYGVRLSADQGYNPFSRLLLLWTTAVTRVGAKRPLQPADLWHLSQSDDPALLHSRFLSAWEAEEQRLRSKGRGGRVSMFRIEWRLFWRELCLSGVYHILSTVCQFGAPTFIRGIVEFAEQTAASGDAVPQPPVSAGLVLALGMFTTQLLAALFGAHSGFLLSRIGVRSRATLSAAVCRHSMRLNAQARASEAAGRGRLLSLLTQDAAKVEMGIQILHRAWMAPLYVIAGMTYIYTIIGFAAFVGFCFMCCAMPMQTRIAKAQRKAQRSKMVHTDKRVSLVSETLNAIKVVKLYAWELGQAARLQAARAEELVALRRFKLFEAFSGPVNVTIPVITSVLTFIAYSAFGNEITPAVAFSVVSLFQIVRSPFSTIPQALAVYAQVQISFSRLSAFFELPMDPEGGDARGSNSLVEPGLIDVYAMNFRWPTAPAASDASAGSGQGPTRLPSENDLGKMKAAEIRSLLQQCYEEGAASAKYGSQRQVGNGGNGEDGGNFELQSVDLRVEPGELVMVVGTVGGGKSSLLAALLGLMDANPSSQRDAAERKSACAVGGRLAYCTQQPFVLSGTVRDNILFGHPYEKQRFADAVRRCCLESDLAQMPEGEDTIIGERGVTLSGGQKARVAMARAAYSRPDIVILDDPLAAVDADVSSSLMSCAILGDEEAPEIPDGLDCKYRQYDDEYERAANIDCSFAQTTCILVTAQLHNCHLADRIVVMGDGRIKEQGSFADLASDPHSTLAEMLQESDQNTGIDSTTSGGKGSPRGRRSRSNSPSTRPAGSPSSMALSPAASANRSSTTASGAEATPTRAKPASTELRKTGKVSGAVWSGYARSGVTSWVSLAILLSMFVVAEACFVSIDTWLAVWADDGMGWSAEAGGVASYIGVYGSLALFYFTVTLVRSVMVAQFGVRASRILYAAMEGRVLGCPMRFFDTTPIGQVINRFSKDTTDTDESLTSSLGWLIMTGMRVTSIIIVISVVQPLFGPVILPLLVLYHFVRQFYRSTSRELQRIESLSRSPVYALFSEIVDGHDTIHAYRQGPRFTEDFEDRLRQNLRALFAQQACAAWFSLSLQMLGGSIVGVCAFTLVVTIYVSAGSGDAAVGAGLVGLALAYSNNIIINLNAVIQIWVGVETKMVGVERILEYAHTLPQEKKQELLLGGSSVVPADWPRFGKVTFDAVSLRYAEHLPLALRQVSFTIEAGTVAGIVGRTGAGKSSMLLALFRIVEPLASGAVLIDGVDIAGVPLQTLRSRLTVIPQEPVLFAGTVRENVDMAGSCADSDILAALEATFLGDALREAYAKAQQQEETAIKNARSTAGQQQDEARGGARAPPVQSLLDVRLGDGAGGASLSVGQRQLLCLARARVRASQVVLLDEATASVDSLTDARLQKTLREGAPFSTATRLIIAHRINTIIDADTVMVLDHGELVEQGTPNQLLTGRGASSKPSGGGPSESAFAMLVDASADAGQLRERAAQTEAEQSRKRELNASGFSSPGGSSPRSPPTAGGRSYGGSGSPGSGARRPRP